MKLEDEIKQKKFVNEFQKLGINLMYTGNWLRLLVTQDLKKHSLSLQQYNVLRILRGQHPNPSSVNLLTERMLDKMSNASRLIEKLKLKGLVERSECKQDRRQAEVLITAKGLTLLEKLDIVLPDFKDRFHDLSEKDALLMNDLLDKLRG